LVRERVESPLHRTIHVETEQFAADTTPWDLGLRVDVPAVVRQAMQHSHDGNILTRLWRRLFGNNGVKASTTPRWGSGELNTVLERAARAVSLDPRNASIDSSPGWVVVVAPKTGR